MKKNKMMQQITFEIQAFNMNAAIDYTGKDLFDFSKSKHTNKKMKLTKKIN